MTLSQVRADEVIQLSSLDLKMMKQDFGSPGVDASVDGHPLTIGSQTFKKGIGTHAASALVIDLKKGAKTFSASVGIDNDAGSPRGSVEFVVYGDGKPLWQSGVMRTGEAAKKVEVDVTGIKTLRLSVTDAHDGIECDHADWADAQLLMTGAAPVAIDVNSVAILTPLSPATPLIHGAKVFGVRPGSPFLFTVAATGERPMTFSADNLPSGLTLDAATGHITGKVAEAGTHKVMLHAKNAKGSTQRELLIKVGDKIALTPPLGWNAWNCFATSVSDEKVRATVDAFVKSGLIDHGWTYINIDDGWVSQKPEPRDKDGMIQSNDRFPDMKALADYIHSKGMKAGLYSSPGVYTCAHYPGSYQHEDEDARQYAAWGFDYLKYDWCTYGEVYKREDNGQGLPGLKKPYEQMAAALKKADRDIFFSFCQYGMGDVWKWGTEMGGNSWRTTGDIVDTWKSMIDNSARQIDLEQYVGPGHWNDPDMLVVGQVGWGPKLHPTRLTADEQYTHISLWCLQAAPLLIGCDVTQLDPFTLGLLSNDEVLDVDQDPLGAQAHLVSHATYRSTTDDYEYEVWAKPMEDGSLAVGIFNLGPEPRSCPVSWADLKIKGARKVRDLWRQQDIGTVDGKFESDIPSHGCMLVRLSAP